MGHAERGGRHGLELARGARGLLVHLVGVLELARLPDDADGAALDLDDRGGTGVEVEVSLSWLGASSR